MLEKAKYFQNKMFRNSIAGFILSGLFIYTSLSENQNHISVILIFISVSILWLTLSFLINQKLKLKDQQGKYEISIDGFFSYKHIDAFFSIAIFVLIILLLKRWQTANYLASLIIVAYLFWLFSELKKIFSYLNSKT